jgi:uncharacterized membrane protein (UPF0127 family)
MYKNIMFKGKNIRAKVCTPLQKISGLMFKKRKKAEPLLFKFRKQTRMAIHSYFVFFPFTAVWYNKNKIIEVKKVNPFTFNIRPKKYFTQLLEIPI